MASHDQQWYMDTGATSHLSSHTVRKFTTDNKCSIDFDPYGFTIRDYHTRQTLLRCDSTGDLYPLHIAASAFALLTNNHSLWHQRLGHPGDAVIQTLSSRGLVSYNKNKNTQHLCRACQLGKQTKLPFQRSTSIVTSPFDIIHSDLWTSPVSSMSGYKYYVLFLDHYSHFLWVYPLYRKSDAQSKLLHFRAFIKTQFNREIKAFQCDHGGEFDNNSLHELFATNGIQFRFSCPRTSQQNGKSERMIRTINNVVRSLLFQARLPPEYWVEALLTATYLLNILPSTSINNDIPYTKLFNKPTSYTHIRTFGCLCYPYTFPPHKLAPRTTPSIFLGYAYNHRGYRCLDLNTNKIIISRHVTFDETVFPFGSMTPTKPPSYQFLDDNLDTSPIALRLLTTPTSPQQTPPQTTNPQTNPQTTPQSTPPTPLSTPSPQTTPTPPTTPPPPPPTSQHPMVTRSKVGIVKANPKYNLHVTTSFPVAPKTVYMHQPPGFTDSAHSDYVLPSKIDSSLFIFHKGPDTTYLLLYVDDIILPASSTSLLQRIISLLHAEFAMTDLVPLNYFLGISTTRTTSGIFLSQTKYATEILEQAQMLNCNPCRAPIDTEKKLGSKGSPDTDPTLYRSLAGSLHYFGLLHHSLLHTLMLTGQDTLSRSSVEAEYCGVANAVAETSWIRNLFLSASNCSLPHSVNEIKAMIQKHIEEEKVCQLTIMNLAVEFENASIAEDDMRKAYEECNDIPEEKRALIDIYLKEESDKDHDMHNALFRKTGGSASVMGRFSFSRVKTDCSASVSKVF
ncbi:ribonuclease H-like domain-containing protein [Tanacetum coccineum]|uniref:Ribonuclease H-like domain-containing protein n=1 Tax=Tanacetum coccineum TaxID=301880 RepID=A0ABQ4ZRD1_9ASTR